MVSRPTEDPRAVLSWRAGRRAAPHVPPAHVSRGPASTCVFLCAVALQNSLIKEGGLHQLLGQIDPTRVPSIFKNTREQTRPKDCCLFWQNSCRRPCVRTRVTWDVAASRGAAQTPSRVTWCVLLKLLMAPEAAGPDLHRPGVRLALAAPSAAPPRAGLCWAGGRVAVPCLGGHVPSAVSRPRSGHASGATAGPGVQQLWVGRPGASLCARHSGAQGRFWLLPGARALG